MRSLYFAIFGRISPLFRRRRMRAFAASLAISGRDRILDLGGNSWNWEMLGDPSLEVTMADIAPYQISPDLAARFPKLKQVYGDATQLPFEDGSFNVVFSNSVIEHLHTWENQQKFASEARRVAGPGGRLWIQTPARSFFIEPHFLTVGLHWLPKSWQLRLLRWLSGWGWINRPSRATIQEWLDEIRLLTWREMRELFPDCELRKEKFLGLWTKSYIAVRASGPAAAPSSPAALPADGPPMAPP
jgi:SAM-dependent methyltransferase